MAEFVPTHRVPNGGMRAWATPDPSAAPVANLDQWLDVQVTEERGAWARVVCSNSWSGWVDGRRLDPIPAPASPAPASQAPTPQPEAEPAAPEQAETPPMPEQPPPTAQQQAPPAPQTPAPTTPPPSVSPGPAAASGAPTMPAPGSAAPSMPAPSGAPSMPAPSGAPSMPAPGSGAPSGAPAMPPPGAPAPTPSTPAAGGGFTTRTILGVVGAVGLAVAGLLDWIRQPGTDLTIGGMDIPFVSAFLDRGSPSDPTIGVVLIVLGVIGAVAMAVPKIPGWIGRGAAVVGLATVGSFVFRLNDSLQSAGSFGGDTPSLFSVMGIGVYVGAVAALVLLAGRPNRAG